VADPPREEQLAEGYKSMAATAKLGWNPPGHNPKLAGRLRRMKSETLILWGDDDRLIPTVYAQAWADRINRAHIVLIKDCGHLLMFEKEEEFVEAITHFLG